MDINKYTILIISETIDIYNLFCKCIDKSTTIIYHSNSSNYKDKLNIINPHIVFIDDLNKEKSLEIIIVIKDFYNSKVQIIIGINENKNLNKYICAGANDYILKPYNENKITIRLNNLLSLAHEKSQSKFALILFNALINNLPYMSWYKDKKSNYMIVNNEFLEHSGKDIDAIRGNGDIFVWDGKIGDKCKEYDLEVMKTKKQKIFNEVIPGKKGYKEFNIYKAPVIDDYNNVLGTIGIARDITELKNQDAKMNIIIENIPVPVWVKDKNMQVINVNKQYLNFFNVNKEDVLGKDQRDIFNKETFNAIKETDIQVMKSKTRVIYETTININTKDKIIEIYKSPIFDISNEVIGIVGLFRDITEVKASQREIERLAYTDMLTGLYNRRALYKFLNAQIKTFKSNIAFMIIDLDNFKKLNDTCGHTVGDKALRLMAKKLKDVCSNEYIARIGGDEFVLVSVDKDPACIKNNVKNLVHKLKTDFSSKDIKNIISVSLGIVIEHNKNTISIEKLFREADIALYKAKEMGRNQCCFYSKELEKEKLLELQIENDLVKAIKNKEIILYYQPQYAINGTLKGFEALFRWKNHKYTHIPTIKIIRILEKNQLINYVGKYIINEACKFAKSINSISKETLSISINISTIQIMKNNFVETIKKIIKENNIKPNQICIEITETVLLQNINDNVQKLKELMNLGISISLDDFGIGYSSLDYLLKLPLSQIKIDRSFIIGMKKNNKYLKLVKLIIDTARSLNLLVVAEGVESKEELQILKEMKVDYIQGYIFSKAISKEEAYKLINYK